jgi:putative ABC transport system permease protein
MLFTVVFGVLLIACTNIAALLLIRADQRRKETALRLAIGVGAWDLARLLLAESLAIGAAGCAGGLLVADACIRAFSIFPRLSVIPLGSLDLTVDWRVCVFAASVTMLCAILFGLAPLRQSMASDLISGLRVHSSAEGTARRGILQMIQIGVALVLLAGASLFLRTFRNAEAADPFLHSGNLMLANVEMHAMSGLVLFSTNSWNRRGFCRAFNQPEWPGCCRCAAYGLIGTRRLCLEQSRDPFQRIRK